MRRQPKRSLIRHQRKQIISGYEIRIAEHLDESSFDWFNEISIANQENHGALLSGAIPDQAAMLRVLLRLNDLGITILRVKALQKRR